MTITELKALITSYINNVSNGTPLTPSDFIISGQDTLLLAINSARRLVEKGHDFEYSNITATFSIASTGSDVNTCTIAGVNQIVKRVSEILLPVSDGYIPIELLSRETYLSRLKNEIGRQSYNPSATMADLGASNDNPFAVQDGSFIFLYPASQYAFPVSARLEGTKFLPDYTGPETLTISGSGTSAINTTWEAFGTYNDRPFFFNYQAGGSAPATVYALWYSGTAWVLTPAANFGNAAASSRYSSTSTAQSPAGLTYTATTFTGTMAVTVASGNVSSDFLLVNGWEYLQWQAILELNKQRKEFTNREEGNVNEESVTALRDAALQSLILWDTSIRKGTTTPIAA